MIYIHEIEVAEISRERGIGKTLLNEMNQICKRKDLMKLLRITNEAKKLQSFYMNRFKVKPPMMTISSKILSQTNMRCINGKT